MQLVKATLAAALLSLCAVLQGCGDEKKTPTDDTKKSSDSKTSSSSGGTSCDNATVVKCIEDANKKRTEELAGGADATVGACDYQQKLADCADLNSCCKSDTKITYGPKSELYTAKEITASVKTAADALKCVGWTDPCEDTKKDDTAKQCDEAKVAEVTKCSTDAHKGFNADTANTLSEVKASCEGLQKVADCRKDCCDHVYTNDEGENRTVKDDMAGLKEMIDLMVKWGKDENVELSCPFKDPCA